MKCESVQGVPMEYGYVLNLNIQRRWNCAKQCKLCFHCLGEGHMGQYCNRTRVCRIDNYKKSTIDYYTKIEVIIS